MKTLLKHFNITSNNTVYGANHYDNEFEDIIVISYISNKSNIEIKPIIESIIKDGELIEYHFPYKQKEIDSNAENADINLILKTFNQHSKSIQESMLQIKSLMTEMSDDNFKGRHICTTNKHQIDNLFFYKKKPITDEQSNAIIKNIDIEQNTEPLIYLDVSDMWDEDSFDDVDEQKSEHLDTTEESVETKLKNKLLKKARDLAIKFDYRIDEDEVSGIYHSSMKLINVLRFIILSLYKTKRDDRYRYVTQLHDFADIPMQEDDKKRLYLDYSGDDKNYYSRFIQSLANRINKINSNCDDYAVLAYLLQCLVYSDSFGWETTNENILRNSLQTTDYKHAYLFTIPKNAINKEELIIIAKNKANTNYFQGMLTIWSLRGNMLILLGNIIYSTMGNQSKYLLDRIHIKLRYIFICLLLKMIAKLNLCANMFHILCENNYVSDNIYRNIMIIASKFVCISSLMQINTSQDNIQDIISKYHDILFLTPTTCTILQNKKILTYKEIKYIYDNNFVFYKKDIDRHCQSFFSKTLTKAKYNKKIYVDPAVKQSQKEQTKLLDKKIILTLTKPEKYKEKYKNIKLKRSVHKFKEMKITTFTAFVEKHHRKHQFNENFILVNIFGNVYDRFPNSQLHKISANVQSSLVQSNYNPTNTINPKNNNDMMNEEKI